MYSAGTSGRISPAWMPPQTLYTSLIYCLSLQTLNATYTVAISPMSRNTAVLFGRFAAAVRCILQTVCNSPVNQTALYPHYGPEVSTLIISCAAHLALGEKSVARYRKRDNDSSGYKKNPQFLSKSDVIC